MKQLVYVGFESTMAFVKAGEPKMKITEGQIVDVDDAFVDRLLVNGFRVFGEVKSEDAKPAAKGKPFQKKAKAEEKVDDLIDEVNNSATVKTPEETKTEEVNNSAV